MKFNINGGIKTVNYTLGCSDANINFIVTDKDLNPLPSESWLKAEKVDGEKKVRITVGENTASQGDRTGFVVAVIGGNCSDKKLKVEQSIEGGNCNCDVSIFDEEDSKLVWGKDEINTEKTVDIENSFCSISDIGIVQATSDFNDYFDASINDANNKITITSKGTAPTSTKPYSTKITVNYKIDGLECKDENSKEIQILWSVLDINDSLELNFDNTTLDKGGNKLQKIGSARSLNRGQAIDVDELSAYSSDSWLTISFSEARYVDGYSTVDIYATYDETPQSRTTTVGVSRNGQAVDEPTNMTQIAEGESMYRYEITKDVLDPCGTYNDKIGTYYYTGSSIIDTASFSFVGIADRPSWIINIGFGTAIPDKDEKGNVLRQGRGDILISYSENETSLGRTYQLGQLLYGSFKEVTPNTGSKSLLTQGYSNSCTPTTPSILPTTCSDTNFYHYHHPSLLKDEHFYYLEHTITSKGQDYMLGTYCDGVDISGNSLIQDQTWEDVKVEIYDIKPRIVHRSACGSHYVDVIDDWSFAQIKEEHERIDAHGNAVHCPCWTGSVHSGEYVVEGYESSSAKLIACYEGRNITYGEGGEQAYIGFWFKFKETEDPETTNENIGINLCRSGNQWEDTCDYRGIKFVASSNVGSDAIERCAMVKVYPKIPKGENGQYCSGTCKDCETSLNCQGGKNTCITDIVIQESVNCGKDEYLDPRHYYSYRYITTKRSEAVEKATLYEYNGVCDNYGNYINAVDIYSASVKRKPLSQDVRNVEYERVMGEYLGTICFDDVDLEYYSRSAYTKSKDDVITKIDFSGNSIYLYASEYTPKYNYGEFGKDRFRTRILVPFHLGINYSGYPFNKDEPYYTYYGPYSLNRECFGRQVNDVIEDCTPSYNGLTDGIFCVLEQDGSQ